MVFLFENNDFYGIYLSKQSLSIFMTEIKKGLPHGFLIGTLINNTSVFHIMIL